MTMAGESSENSHRECNGKVSGKRKRKVGLLYDEGMCKHDTPDGEDHPECPNRIRVIWEKLQLTGLAQRCVVLGGSKAEDKHLQLVHTNDHVKMVKRISTKQKDSRRNKIASRLDSIYLNGGSSEAAYLAAGSVVKVAEKVAAGELDCGFAIVRPPGHHAKEDEAMGFCLFNNVAVAASYLLNERADLGIRKILIVDWDVHHGNGTQRMFWKDPRVLVFSVHRHEFGNFYPTGGDGYYDMVGEGPGEGLNINVPWENRGYGDADYLAAWDEILIPVTKEFNPDIILLSAGFDAAIGDPLGGCYVTPYGYSVMLKKLMEFAQGKIVMALEGGYNLDSVAKSSLACVQVLLEEKPIQGSCEDYPFQSALRVMQAVRKRLCAYWPSLADEWKYNVDDPLTSDQCADLIWHLGSEHTEKSEWKDLIFADEYKQCAVEQVRAMNASIDFRELCHRNLKRSRKAEADLRDEIAVLKSEKEKLVEETALLRAKCEEWSGVEATNAALQAEVEALKAEKENLHAEKEILKAEKAEMESKKRNLFELLTSVLDQF